MYVYASLSSVIQLKCCISLSVFNNDCQYEVDMPVLIDMYKYVKNISHSFQNVRAYV
jgi:hypothetical protein